MKTNKSVIVIDDRYDAQLVKTIFALVYRKIKGCELNMFEHQSTYYIEISEPCNTAGRKANLDFNKYLNEYGCYLKKLSTIGVLYTLEHE